MADTTQDKDARIAELEAEREALIRAIVALRAFRGLPDGVLTEVSRRERALAGDSAA